MPPEERTNWIMDMSSLSENDREKLRLTTEVNNAIYSLLQPDGWGYCFFTYPFAIERESPALTIGSVRVCTTETELIASLREMADKIEQREYRSTAMPDTTPPKISIGYQKDEDAS